MELAPEPVGFVEIDLGVSMGVSMGARKLVNVVLSGLAGELQDIRNQRKLVLEKVCDELEWEQSKLSRMENGQQCISDIDLGSLLAVYGITRKERGYLLRMAERQDDPGYWETSSPMTEESRTLKRLERSTTAIVDVTTVLIPELAQTADYARAVMESEGMATEEIAARVEARLARQSILTKCKSPKVDLIMGEEALRRTIGDRNVMAQQLHALHEIAQNPDVRLRVVPFEMGGDAGGHTAFSVMEFPRRSVVYLSHPTTSLFLEQDDVIEFYRRRVARLAKVVLEPAESMDLIVSITREFRLAGDAHNSTGRGFPIMTAG